MAQNHVFDRHHTQDLLKRSGRTVADVWTDVQSFKFKWIVPYETAFSARIVRNPTTWVMLFFGFTPLLAVYVAATVSQLMAWQLAYFALAWAAYFYIVVAKRNSDLKIGLGIALFTIFIGFPLYMWFSRMPPFSWFLSLTKAHSGVAGLVGWVVGIGVNEELWKAVPVLLVALWLRRVSKPLDGLFYGAMSGLGFAVSEGLWFMNLAQVRGADEILRQALIRTTESTFIHATFTAMSGYFIALAVLSPGRRTALCILGIAVPAALHGWFDFVADDVIGLPVAALSYLLLVSYIDRSQEMMADLQQAEATAVHVLTAADA